MAPENRSRIRRKEETITTVRLYPGKSFPVGATVYKDGINFSVFSVHASAIEILLFESSNSSEPFQVFRLEGASHRTYNYWHAFISGLGNGQIYAFRAYGPFDPHSGLRFDSQKVLLDPYAKFVTGWDRYDRHGAIDRGNNCAQALRSVALDVSEYDWEDDAHPRTPYADSIIYELHVGSFTRNPNSGLRPTRRGTFAGLAEKIPYLVQLGVTALSPCSTDTLCE